MESGKPSRIPLGQVWQLQKNLPDGFCVRTKAAIRKFLSMVLTKSLVYQLKVLKLIKPEFRGAEREAGI
jgi:hypothetical protein